MKFFAISSKLAACSLAVFGLSQCIITPDPDPSPRPSPGAGSGSAGSGSGQSTGTISVFSSIDGDTHSSQCDRVGATDLELAIYEGDRFYKSVVAPCYDFQVSAAMPEGDFNADVTLLDAYAEAVSTTLMLNNLRVIAGSDLQIEVDFPSNSILW